MGMCSRIVTSQYIIDQFCPVASLPKKFSGGLSK